MKNKGREQLRRGANEQFTRPAEERSEQRVVCRYCEIATRNIVTVLEGYREKQYRGVPCGWRE